MPLYQKHKPQTFDDIIGQDAVVRQVKTMLARPPGAVPEVAPALTLQELLAQARLAMGQTQEIPA